jgi:hypothetical protein
MKFENISIDQIIINHLQGEKRTLDEKFLALVDRYAEGFAYYHSRVTHVFKVCDSLVMKCYNGNRMQSRLPLDQFEPLRIWRDDCLGQYRGVPGTTQIGSRAIDQIDQHDIQHGLIELNGIDVPGFLGNARISESDRSTWNTKFFPFTTPNEEVQAYRDCYAATLERHEELLEAQKEKRA